MQAVVGAKTQKKDVTVKYSLAIPEHSVAVSTRVNDTMEQENKTIYSSRLNGLYISDSTTGAGARLDAWAHHQSRK